MADAKSTFSSLNALLAFAFIIGLFIWLALVLTSEGEERLEQACKPVEYTTQLLHDVTAAIIGRQPTWTLYVQQYLMTGCYYSFSVLMSQRLPGDDSLDAESATGEPATGGIQ